jgi:hypothetical protein
MTGELMALLHELHYLGIPLEQSCTARISTNKGDPRKAVWALLTLPVIPVLFEIKTCDRWNFMYMKYEFNFNQIMLSF